MNSVSLERDCHLSIIVCTGALSKLSAVYVVSMNKHIIWYSMFILICHVIIIIIVICCCSLNKEGKAFLIQKSLGDAERPPPECAIICFHDYKNCVFGLGWNSSSLSKRT